jgi:hypothetical protein
VNYWLVMFNARVSTFWFSRVWARSSIRSSSAKSLYIFFHFKNIVLTFFNAKKHWFYKIPIYRQKFDLFILKKFRQRIARNSNKINRFYVKKGFKLMNFAELTLGKRSALERLEKVRYSENIKINKMTNNYRSLLNLLHNKQNYRY